MATDPIGFFAEAVGRDVVWSVPLLLLFILGVFGSISTVAHIPAEKKFMEQRYAHGIEEKLSIKKTGALYYPLWVMFMWAGFSLFFAYLISRLGGDWNLKGIFNCTTFLIFPSLISGFLLMLSTFVHHIARDMALLLNWFVIGWTVYLVFTAGRGAGKLNEPGALLASVVSVGAFSFVWYTYELLVILTMVKPLN